MLSALRSTKSEPPKKINQVEALSIGDWVHFLQGEERNLAKLAWKAEDSTLFIFVDRDGKRVCEVDTAELARQFVSGEISLTDAKTGDAKKTQFSFMKGI